MNLAHSQSCTHMAKTQTIFVFILSKIDCNFIDSFTIDFLANENSHRSCHGVKKQKNKQKKANKLKNIEKQSLMIIHGYITYM